jgi:hypothetical protein
VCERNIGVSGRTENEKRQYDYFKGILFGKKANEYEYITITPLNKSPLAFISLSDNRILERETPKF